MKPKVAVCSLFRDCEKEVNRYFYRLTSLWDSADIIPVCIEGDSKDGTLFRLNEHICPDDAIVISKFQGTPNWPHIPSPDRLKALAELANIALERALVENPDYVLWLESDLTYKRDFLGKLLSYGKEAIAPYVFYEGTDIFYDCWAFRWGMQENPEFRKFPPGTFKSFWPYRNAEFDSAIFNPDEFKKPYIVQSAGSCLLMKADLVRNGARFGDEAIVSLCKSIWSQGIPVWADSNTQVYHPFKSRFEHLKADIRRALTW